MEVVTGIGSLKRYRASGSDGLSLSHFKDDGKVLASKLTKLMGSVGEKEQNPRDWCKSVIAPSHKKFDRSSCANHRGIDLVGIASKLLVGTVLQRLSSTRERCIRENQADFHPGRCCNGQNLLCDIF